MMTVGQKIDLMVKAKVLSLAQAERAKERWAELQLERGGPTMGQTRETGDEGRKNGYRRADEIAALIGAVRVSPISNEFESAGRRIVIKTGPSAVITEATLSRVEAVFYGEYRDGGWAVYELDPQSYRGLSVPSRSTNHDESYRQVRKTQIRQFGRKVL
jgi:hypothetical protein